MITLYGMFASRAVRCIWALEELGLVYEHEPVSHIDGSTRTVEFLAMNPAGKTPVLRDGDVVMFESIAINLYLAQKYGEQALWPSDDASRAAGIQWSFWAVAELEPPVVTMMVERVFKPEAVRDEAAAQLAEDSLPAILNTIEVSLGDGDYLAGDLFTVADLNAAAVAGSLAMAGFDTAAFPKLAGWLERCHARPAYEKLQSLRPAR